MTDPTAASRRWEAGVALVLLAAAGSLFLAVPHLVSGWAFVMPGTTNNSLQPSFFPRLMLILLGCAALGVLATSRLRRQAIPLVETTAPEWAQLGKIIALVLAYFLALFMVGFVPSSVLFVLATAHVVGFRRPVLTVLVGLAFPVCTFLVFRFAMSVMLPTGLLG